MDSSTLRAIYSHTLAKYAKLRERLQRHLQKGTYKSLPGKKKQHVSMQLKRTERRLSFLQAQLGLLATTALVSATNHTAHAQNLGPFVSNADKNPLPPPYQITRPKPAVVDIDNDGDLDVFVGDKYGVVHFFRNDGGAETIKRFVKIKDNENPADVVQVSSGAAPAFIDVDNDGDYDMLVGSRSSRTYFFRNTGTASSPQFEEEAGASNPFFGVRGSTNNYGTAEATPTFVDFDDDGDKDLIIGTTYIGDPETGNTQGGIRYYKNTNGTFTLEYNSLSSTLYTTYNNSLAFADVDNDGDLDVFVGRSNYIWLLKNDEGSFNASTGPWDPEAHTGNPFHATFFNDNTAPALGDFDGDGDLDVLVGSVGNFTQERYAQPSRYFENTGGFVMDEQRGLNVNPLDGVDVGDAASIQLTDLDGDGDLDVVIGSKYSNPRIFFYYNQDGEYIPNTNLDWDGLLNGFSVNVQPSFVDIDADGDQDAFIGNLDEFTFLRNTGGEFQYESSPLTSYSSTVQNYLTVAFIDIDQDGDFDAFVGGKDNFWNPAVAFLENTGNAVEPIFTPSETPPAPFNDLSISGTPQLATADYDHDGDLDLFITDTYYDYSLSRYVSFVRVFQNDGNGGFAEINTLDFNQYLPRYSRMSFADTDNDGDLDILMGLGGNLYANEDGQVQFFENQNPPPQLSINATVLQAAADQLVIVDPGLLLTDEDGDNIVIATITIEDFQVDEEELTFTPSGNITGFFDTSTGELTLTGTDNIDTYQAVLQSVAYQYYGTVNSDRGRINSFLRTITFDVRDADYTLFQSTSRQINVNTGNSAPVITPQSITVQPNDRVVLNLVTIITDPDNNFTPGQSTIEIVEQPLSGATASLDFVSTTEVNLVIDYGSVTFKGTDQLRIRATDDLGLQTEQDIQIEVDVVADVVVFNAVSPNQDALNDYLHINGLTAGENVVSVYNRWGDEVFKVSDYSNTDPGRRFEGVNKNGKELPSGNYFYKIENKGKTTTGYLSLKR